LADFALIASTAARDEAMTINRPHRLTMYCPSSLGTFTGVLKTLHVAVPVSIVPVSIVPVSIVPVDKMSDNAPDHRVYAGQRHEIGAG
jgi:uncharacterized protein (DUF736 family)